MNRKTVNNCIHSLKEMPLNGPGYCLYKTLLLEFIKPILHALQCEHKQMHNALRVSVFRECYHQGVLVSLKVVSFELVRNVSHSHSQAQILKLD